MAAHVLSSRYFGALAFTEEDRIAFPRGVPAFEERRCWVLLDDGQSSLRWFQSLEDEALAFPVTAPEAVMADYNARISEDDLALVGASDEPDASELILLIVLSIPEASPWEMTANLRAPILLNLRTRRAVQVIALNEEYSIRHPALPEKLQETMRRQHARRLEGRLEAQGAQKIRAEGRGC